MSIDLSLQLVTDTAQCGARGVPAVVAAAVAGGVTTVQIRDHDASAAELVALTLAVAAVLTERTTLLVDDRVDVVLAARFAGARVHGVHLGQSDLPVVAARSLLGADALIGLTANTPAHLAAVRALPAGTVDYLGVGVIRPTSTKPDHPAPLGVDGFAALATATPLPCVAIGGVGAQDAAPLRRAGAAGLAVVSAVCTAVDPTEAARSIRAQWDR
ncbi:thiamine phosphate synthase [Rathayibacter rathayi]|uniref:thiamine phosphate synthase n=1 Tax=Rathayibacter rathayi TaxID=33887 RepID=UPI000BC7B1E4|nr:thiamine phosphate synthase [Rathayibacter rathayi]AZZ49128.1 thiamine phosphate synthase [Rathayibacter rathayi]MWV73179.1 thiamine phosphate synthase [Rathayibacter rathayi NCPPB 2980 = VKM Ac-1601]PPF83457.1 thiamine phosphate synthase [Rathayibacter rathayi]PPG16276.1 thiamine phosphate synthase [Rathayibacter rathayi]PPG47277.1 thiamine phosphate synthase [Rathayibacter rathayi]